MSKKSGSSLLAAEILLDVFLFLLCLFIELIWEAVLLLKWFLLLPHKFLPDVPSPLLGLASLTLITLVIHPDGCTWILLRKMRNGLSIAAQSIASLWSVVVHEQCTIVSTLLAAATFSCLFFLCYLMHRTLARKPKPPVKIVNKKKVKRKNNSHRLGKQQRERASTGDRRETNDEEHGDQDYEKRDTTITNKLAETDEQCNEADRVDPDVGQQPFAPTGSEFPQSTDLPQNDSTALEIEPERYEVALPALLEDTPVSPPLASLTIAPICKPGESAKPDNYRIRTMSGSTEDTSLDDQSYESASGRSTPTMEAEKLLCEVPVRKVVRRKKKDMPRRNKRSVPPVTVSTPNRWTKNNRSRTSPLPPPSPHHRSPTQRPTNTVWEANYVSPSPPPLPPPLPQSNLTHQPDATGLLFPAKERCYQPVSLPPEPARNVPFQESFFTLQQPWLPLGPPPGLEHNVRENPFQTSDDELEAELQELGGQMVCSILDF